MKDIERIIPTVWINNQLEFNELMGVFSEKGIKKLRINCTRNSASGYIKEIFQFQKNWGDVFELILDIPIPRKKVRVFYDWKGMDFEVNQDVMYTISPIRELNKTHCGMYVEENDFNKLVNICEGTFLLIGENQAVLRVESRTKNKIYVKGMCRGTVPYGKYITTSEIKYVECDKTTIEEYIKLIKESSCYGVALSFVENAEDVKVMRKKLGNNTRIISKIETIKGVNNLNEIIEVSDEIIIARGDLFINAGYEFFAKACNTISAICEMKGKKYHFATGILESCSIGNMRPSRSEMCELYNIFRCTGADIILEYNKCKTAQQALEVLNIIEKIIS